MIAVAIFFTFLGHFAATNAHAQGPGQLTNVFCPNWI